MGERKGTNKYYPPDFNPKFHKNLNAYHGTHALRERGRKADQGVIIIRFEMPFNCWCLTCKNPIGMGVRYNAQKTKVGMYHSTPIYKFSMPCHLCAGTIVIQTDPQNFDYVILEGARRKVQKWDAEENEQVVLADHAEKKKLALDAMYHLEHEVKDKSKTIDIAPALIELEVDRQKYRDDFFLNQMARKRFRETKAKIIAKSNEDSALLNRLSLTGSEVQLLPESEEDSNNAKVMKLTQFKKDSHIATTSRTSLDEEPIFNNLSKTKVESCFPKEQTCISPHKISPVGLSNSSNSSNGALSLAVSKRQAHLLNHRGEAFVPSKVNCTSKPTSDTARLLSNGVRLVASGFSNENLSTKVGPITCGLVSYAESDSDQDT